MLFLCKNRLFVFLLSFIGLFIAVGCQTLSTPSPTSSSAPAGSGILTLSITQNTTTEAATFRIVISQGSSIITSSEASSVSLGAIKDVSFTLPNGTYTAEAFIDQNNDKSADNTEYYDRKDNVAIADNTQNVDLSPNIQKSYWGTNTISGTNIDLSSNSTSLNKHVGLYVDDMTKNSSAVFYGRFISKEASMFSYKFKVKNGTYYVAAFSDVNGNNIRDGNDSIGVFDWNGVGDATAEAIIINSNDASGKGFNIYVPATTSLSWDITTLEAEIGDGQSYRTSLSLDSSKNVYVSYYNAASFSLDFMTNSSGAWIGETADANISGKYNSLALDSNRKAHISYYDNVNEDLKYAANSSGKWVKETIDSTGSVGIYTSIALDNSGKLHISYYDSTNGDLKYATKEASGDWIFSTIDSAGDVGRSSSIAIDSSGKAHISYYDLTNGDLKYATNSSGGWVRSTVDSGGDVGIYTSIVLDSYDKAHIAYKDNTNKYLKYTTNKLGPWATETVDSNSEAGSYCDIDIDSNGKAHISYYRYNPETLEGSLKYATNSTGSWITSTVEDAVYNAFVSVVGTDTSIKVDSSGKIYISYFYNPGSTASSSIKIAVSK